ncbi:MAG: hypothetical protein AB7P24_17470 [Nitrospira sp.]
MAIQESPTPQHWNYFLALEDDINRLSRYLEPTEANFRAYSLELARILLAAASEVDIVAKQLCNHIDTSNTANNMDQYRTKLMGHRPEIAQSMVLIPKFGLSLSPWKCWANNQNPVWWRAYNKVKHERHVHFPEANLKNALNSVAGLFSLLLFHYRKEAHDGALSPDPILYRAGAPFRVDKLSYAPHTYTYRLTVDSVA